MEKNLTPKKNHIKILVVGDEGGGKTSLILNYLKREFSLTVDVHLRGVNWFRKIMHSDNEENKKDTIFDIWDIAGADRFKLFIPTLTSFIDGVLITFDSSSADSLNNLSQWIELIMFYVPPSIPKLLVSLRSDLGQILTSENLERFLNKHKVKEYIVTSSETKININKPFESIIALIKSKG